MANINISDLTPTGSHFFLNSENYLNELSDSELNSTYGGIFSPFQFPKRPPFPIPIPWL
jgi:hypothetical protein